MTELRPRACTRPPVAIGGIGGSGTRLIAQILRQLGYYMGDDLNAANDNLWFTLLFKRTELRASGIKENDFKENDFDQAVRVFRKVMSERSLLTADEVVFVRRLAAVDRPHHRVAWLRHRAESLLRSTRCHREDGLWGWKEPNTHVLLDRLEAAFPGMKYIHVMRNGLDMALSKNQNQLRLWGRYFFGAEDYAVSPRWSLKYWCLVHRRIVRLGEQRMREKYMLLNYDAFCAAPQEHLRHLLRFLDLAVSKSTEASLAALVWRPSSIGRFKQYDPYQFDPEDLECIKSFGFNATVTD
jgi:hypothetical protein